MSDTIRDIRAAYPAYDDMSDEELTLAWAEKYPIYLGQDAEFKEDFESYSADSNSDDTTWGMIRNAWLRGQSQATTADVLVGETGGGKWSEEDRIAEMAHANKRSQMLQGSAAYQEFAAAPEEDKIGRFFRDPFEITSQVIIESLSAQISYGRIRVPVATGMGAGAGSVIPGAGTIAGMGAGFVAGNVVTTLGLSYGSKFNEMLQGEGVDITNPEAIKTAMADPEFVSRARNKSLKYGIPIAVVDAITMKLGGLVAGSGRKLLTESVGGAAGEAAGQLVSEGEITSPSEVLIEGVAEFGPGAVQQAGMSGINLLKDKNVQKDLKKAQEDSDAIKTKREQTVLGAFLDDMKKRQEETAAQPTTDGSQSVDLGKKVLVTPAGANVGEILQPNSVPNKVVTGLDDAKFSDFEEVVFIDSDDPHIAQVTGIGRLTVNVRRLKAHIKETGIDADEYIKRLIQEESIHDAHLKSILGEWETNGGDLSFDEFATQRFEKIASEMTDAQKDYVRGVYGDTGSDAEMGAEFVRMLVQERRHGDITESVLWNELGLKPAPSTRGYFRRAYDFMRRSWVKPDLDPETIRADVENLSGILSDIEARSNDMSDVELRRAEQAETAESVARQEQIELQRAEDAPTSVGMEQQAAVEDRRAKVQTDVGMEQQAAVEERRAAAPPTDPQMVEQERREMAKAEPQTLEEVLREPLEQTASEAVIPTSEVIADRKSEVVAETVAEPTAETVTETEPATQPEPVAETVAEPEPTTEPVAEPELTAEENQFIEDVARKQANKHFHTPAASEDAAVSAATDTKLAILKKLGDGTLDRSRFKGLATTIAANNVLTAGRTAQRRSVEQTVTPDETGQTVIDRESTGVTPSDIVRKREQLKRVAAAIDKLPKAQREVMQLMVAEGLTIPEIMERTGKKRASVDTALSRARANLVSKGLHLGASTQSRRSLELIAAQEKFKASKRTLVDREELAKAIAEHKPIQYPIPIPTKESLLGEDEIINSLVEEPKKKAARAYFKRKRAGDKLRHGELIDARIDIPAFNATGNYVVTLHDPGIGPVRGYDSFVHLGGGADGVSFVTQGKQEKTQKIALGAKKTRFAVVRGKHISTDVLPDVTGWTQVGFDPERHSYFYDRSNPANKVISADEAVSIGNTVFVRGNVKTAPAHATELYASTKRPDKPAASDKAQLRSVLDEIAKLLETAPEGMSYEAAVKQVLSDMEPEATAALDVEAGVKTDKTMGDVDKIFQPLETEKPTLGARLRGVIESFSTNFLTRFAPLKHLERKVFKLSGKKAPVLDMARKFEQLAGSPARAEKIMMDFHKAVVKPIKGLTKEFNRLMFLLRTRSRLVDNQRKLDEFNEQIAEAQARAENTPEQIQELRNLRKEAAKHRKRVADWTLAGVDKLLIEMLTDPTKPFHITESQRKLLTSVNHLKKDKDGKWQIDPDAKPDLDESGIPKVGAIEQYQEFMGAMLRMQVDSGRMSQETLDKIVASNDFYAPFVVLKHLEDSESQTATGERIDTTKQLTQMITGIDDTDFRLGGFIDAAYDKILTSYMLADKNLKMQELYELSKLDDTGLVRELKETKVGKKKTVREKADHEVTVFIDGEQKHLAVNKEVADAIAGLNAQATHSLVWAMRMASISMKAGATTFNMAFQFVNLFAADIPRLAMMSKYGFRSPVDLIRLPLDYVYSLFTSIAGNVGAPNALYKQFLESGAARSTLQRELTPELFKIKPTERAIKLTPMGFIRLAAQLASSIEETSKLTGLRRAMRIEKLAKMTPAQQREAMANIVTEVRNFSGSPDFGRTGAVTKAMNLNLVFMYFNARIQGVAADLGRLVGKDGGKNAALAQLRLAAAVGVPTVMLWALNNSDEFEDDWEEIPERDKENYWHIPTDQFFENDEGKMIRDYYRIPKREISKLFSNVVESSLGWLKTREPKKLKMMAVTFLENIMPVSVSGDNMNERMESVISSLNPLFKAPLEMATGRNTWLHRDTVPDYIKSASPNNQYYASTPEIFKAIAKEVPEALPESLRSPLVLKQLTGTMTAGLITQFIPPRETGRAPLGVFSDQSPLFRRFIRSPYVNETADQEALKKIERQETDRHLDERRRVDKFIEDTKGMADLTRMMRARNASNGSRTMFRKFKKAIEDDANLTTRMDKRIRGLGVASNARSMFIMQQMDDMTYTGKIQYLQGLYKKKVVTRDVAAQIFRQTGISPADYAR